MRRILLTIKYDGTDYHGWQVQSNAITIQEVLQNAIEKVFRNRLDVKGCSRTDSGVHANEYMVSFDTDSNIEPADIENALNTFLPDDIRVINAVDTNEDFHPRYSCVSKEYVYCVDNGKVKDPFKVRYSQYYRRHIDEQLLNDVAKEFIGKHDFKSFCNIKTDVEDTIRDIKYFDVYRENDFVYFKVCADGFLYNMVRIMVGTLIAVNEGRIKKGEIQSIIESQDRIKAGKTMPAKGLFLNKVNY